MTGQYITGQCITGQYVTGQCIRGPYVTGAVYWAVNYGAVYYRAVACSIIMPRCACASEVYGSVSVCLCRLLKDQYIGF